MTVVAIVLPPREAFSAAHAGAIALLVQRQAVAASRFRQIVVGKPVAEPFPGSFVPAPPAWLPLPIERRYAAGTARVLRRLRPALVEVHNRPLVARRLARLGAPVALILHNDPTTMRGWPVPAAMPVAAVSAWLAGRTGRTDATVLPNCIDLAALPWASPVRERLILFAGRMVADKGADAFVAACARALPQLPGWRAAMIGADRFGADSPETPFLQALRPRARAARVTLAGWQPHAAVLDAMAHAAIVVVPSRWPEPFGMTALEAAACGAAVALAPRGGLPEILGDAAVSIDPDDPAGMAETLVALACDPNRRAALSRAARRRVAAFDIGPAMTWRDAWREAVLATAAARPPI